MDQTPKKKKKNPRNAFERIETNGVHLQKPSLNLGGKASDIPMAATEQRGNSFAKKRKRIHGSQTVGGKPYLKKPMLARSNEVKPKKSASARENKEQLTKRERRIQAKELAEARKKKRKRHYSLEQELALKWEQMRRHNIGKEEKSKLVSEALQKMKGKMPEIAGSHVSSRVLQTCIKYCSQAERDSVYEELRPHLLTLACNTYAVHLVKKLLDNASKSQVEGFVSSLHGHVASLLRHMVGSVVIEHAYQLGNASQKQRLLMELYSTEFQLFKDLVSTKECRLVDIISKLGLQKASVRQHMISRIQPILEKGIVDHSIIHKVLMEFFSIADKSSSADVLQQLSGSLLVRMIHTRDGSKIGMLCVKHGSAKERKKIIKGMKGHIGKIAHDQCGNMVLVSILSTVDDTKLVTKVVIRELQTILKELVLDKNGRRPLLQILHPNCHSYFGPEDLASLNLSIPSLCVKIEGSEVNPDPEKPTNSPEVVDSGGQKPENDTVAVADAINSTSHGEGSQSVEGGKKDPSLRRLELLIESGLAESLIGTCIESAGELLKSKFGKDIIYEVATGAADGVLWSTFAEKLNALHGAIAFLASQPKTEESNEEHLFENFHSSRTIRKLIMDCPSFASTLWRTALQGKSETWARGHSYKVISAFLESSHPDVRELAKPELQPLLDAGVLKIPKTTTFTKEGQVNCLDAQLDA